METEPLTSTLGALFAMGPDGAIRQLSAAGTPNLYRTKWLIAHNVLHDLVHKTILDAQNLDPAIRESVEKQFQAYLLELQCAATITSQPA